jgi:cytochrome P450
MGTLPSNYPQGWRRGGRVAWWMPGIIFRAIAANMLTADEPHLARLRSIVDEAFRRRAICHGARIQAIADELAAELF